MFISIAKRRGESADLWAGSIAQVIEHLPKKEPPELNPSTAKKILIHYAMGNQNV
jgi:hypothetical protein